MDSVFTDEELKQANDVLGPEYFAAQRIADEFIESFKAGQFESLVDQFTDKFRDRLWDDIATYLLDDTAMNLQSKINNLVEGTVDALLTGEEWAMKRYPFYDYCRGEKIRAEVAKHGGDELQRRRIADLEKELKSLRETLEWHRS